MISVVIILYIMVGYFNLIPLYKRKQKKGFWVNLCLSMISFMLAILISLGVDIPSPAVPIETVIKEMLGL